MKILGIHRLLAIAKKEFLHLVRDKGTFGMIFGIPIIQLVLFGYVINTDPKNLPTYIISNQSTPVTRSLVAALNNSLYFRVISTNTSSIQAERALQRGQATFVIWLESDFDQKLIRGQKPVIGVQADAADPVAIGPALTNLKPAIEKGIKNGLPLFKHRDLFPETSYDLRIHRNYNPESISSTNIVPGLIGVLLTMTMMMMTGMTITKEREKGNLENLLATPTNAVEVMLGKILPYVLIGILQVCLILIMGKFLFDVPILGNLWLLSLCALVFIFSGLSLGLTFSTFAQNQMQAFQFAFFFFLPSMLLSGFMFPFRGMPKWAQYIGEILPLTHFLRIVRAIMLKGAVWADIRVDFYALSLFTLVVFSLAVLFYKKTLD